MPSELIVHNKILEKKTTRKSPNCECFKNSSGPPPPTSARVQLEAATLALMAAEHSSVVLYAFIIDIYNLQCDVVFN